MYPYLYTSNFVMLGASLTSSWNFTAVGAEIRLSNTTRCRIEVFSLYEPAEVRESVEIGVRE
mgnify:CR=1 FL=1